jgi:hypothetical protein
MQGFPPTCERTRLKLPTLLFASLWHQARSKACPELAERKAMRCHAALIWAALPVGLPEYPFEAGRGAGAKRIQVRGRTELPCLRERKVVGVEIEVERPIARPPPHRSRRADFPHRALQKYSLPHSGITMRQLQLVESAARQG